LGGNEEGNHAIWQEEDEALANAIEQEEEKTQQSWIEEHGIVDGDGRARCSFAFCRKLFKDETFLRKHLLKKHADFLKAEMAKCHDSYMMQAWDAEEHRPVLPILVDCGSNFGLVPSNVTGGETPTALDPEPELWRKEEERRKRLADQEHYRQRRQEEETSNTAAAPPPPPRRNHFVDVDDMKEEKVELSFENVQVLPPPKKKKKKKKLL